MGMYMNRKQSRRPRVTRYTDRERNRGGISRRALRFSLASPHSTQMPKNSVWCTTSISSAGMKYEA